MYRVSDLHEKVGEYFGCREVYELVYDRENCILLTDTYEHVGQGVM